MEAGWRQERYLNPRGALGTRFYKSRHIRPNSATLSAPKAIKAGALV